MRYYYLRALWRCSTLHNFFYTRSRSADTKLRLSANQARCYLPMRLRSAVNGCLSLANTGAVHYFLNKRVLEKHSFKSNLTGEKQQKQFIYFLCNWKKKLNIGVTITQKYVSFMHLFQGQRPPREPSGSVVECLTRDRRAAGSSPAGVTALWSLSKTLLS